MLCSNLNTLLGSYFALRRGVGPRLVPSAVSTRRPFRIGTLVVGAIHVRAHALHRTRASNPDTPGVKRTGIAVCQPAARHERLPTGPGLA